MSTLTANTTSSARDLAALPSDGKLLHVVAFAAALIPTLALGWIFFAQ